MTHIRYAFDEGSLPREEVLVAREAYRDACAELAITKRRSRQHRMVALCVREMIDLGEFRKDRIVKATVIRCRSLGNLIGEGRVEAR
ncbi:hypothetical protein [Phreatobacter sp. AB_2022a]|uniref:hypothetical protein n=1 Tax=Phreatobacter sp. AB_2022a TaxID=3003134 RepID=UPI000579B20F|nr:hypothetical protein [Phreatobacter sp. AB_2022a]MCZ0737065.1 hypothetical protein [Phreatobacter sp. AB_2022a]CEJ13342.1 hypothetical protein BN1110_03655 [bacterium YEK0313]